MTSSQTLFYFQIQSDGGAPAMVRDLAGHQLRPRLSAAVPGEQEQADQAVQGVPHQGAGLHQPPGESNNIHSGSGEGCVALQAEDCLYLNIFRPNNASSQTRQTGHSKGGYLVIIFCWSG